MSAASEMSQLTAFAHQIADLVERLKQTGEEFFAEMRKKYGRSA